MYALVAGEIMRDGVLGNILNSEFSIQRTIQFEFSKIGRKDDVALVRQ